MLAPPPTWRSLLYVPAGNRAMLARAADRGADALILDLEDGVAPADKAAARDGLVEAVALAGRGPAAILVRVNRPLDLAVADIAAAVRPGVAALWLPKLAGPEHVRLLAELVAAREADADLPAGSIRLVAQIETAAALPLLSAIAGAHPRLVAIGFGNEDLATDLGGEPVAELLLPLGIQLVAAARAAGLLPLGPVARFADYTDLDAYRAALELSRRIGMAGCPCIHPAQVAIANAVFGLSEGEAARARAMIAAFEAAGGTPVAFQGTMVDLPVVERARRALEGAR